LVLAWALAAASTADGTWEILAGIAIPAVLAALSVYADVLTPSAGGIAAVFGIAIVLVGGPPYLAMLILFVLGGSLATRYGWDEKAARKLAEGKKGERGVTNVLAHILVPMGLVSALVLGEGAPYQGLISFAYVAAMATGMADTMASEFGVLSRKAYSILGRGPVAAGTNGGVSAAGEMWALVGSLLTVSAGAGIFYLFGGLAILPSSVELWFLGGTFLGFLGCQIDSLLGETLENRGYLGKGSVNLLAMLLTTLFAAGLYFA
jgi:uncharacterized protein (TIGR00297 family)